MRNKVSVIMSCYNEKEEWIQQSIESILDQTYIDLEFIVVIDNPSNSEIVRIVTEYSKLDERIKVVINNENMGLVSSLNKAIELSTGMYIARMDADDISELLRIEKQLEYMIENPELDLIGCNIEAIDENGDSKGKRSLLPHDHNMISCILPKTNFFNHPTWFGKRNIFTELEGYRHIDRNEDYDFLLRALSSGYKLGNLNEYLLKYRVRSNSISRTEPLKQYIATRYSKEMFKERNANMNDSHTIDKFNQFIDEKCTYRDINKYNKATKELNRGMKLIRNDKRIIYGILIILKSLCMSRYTLVQFIELIGYKYTTRKNLIRKVN